MSPDDFDSRLRRVELQVIELIAPLSHAVTSLQQLIAEHQWFLFGKPGDDQSTSIAVRVDRLEQARSLQSWLAGAAFGCFATVAGPLLSHYFGF